MSWLKFCLLLIAPAVTFAQNSIGSEDDGKFYSSRYDNVDVEVIFRSSRLLNNYVDCLLDKKPCPPEGKDLKRVLPHALRTKCARCTKIQKAKALDVITRLYYHHPSVYLALAGRYDPTGEYTKNFENWFDEQQRDKVNEVPYKQQRIPSTWITSPTTTPPRTTTTTTSRPTLRTLPSTVRIRVIPTERPANVFPPQQQQPVTTTTTQRPPQTTTVAVIPLQRRDPQLIDRELSPPRSSSFRPFQQQQQPAPADSTFRSPGERTFQAPAAAVRTFPAAATTSATLPAGGGAAAVTATRPVLPSSPAPAITAPRSPVHASGDAAAGTRHSSPAGERASAAVLPTVQFTQRPPLPSAALPAVAFSAVPVSADAVQPLSAGDLASPVPATLLPPPPTAAAAAPPFLNFAPRPPVTYRTPPVQRPSLSINDASLIDSFFVPRSGPIRRSINQLLDTANSAAWTFFNG